MTFEEKITQAVIESIKELYDSSVGAESVTLQKTKKEFEGDFTLVVFPLLRISHSSPDNTGAAIGGWFKDNVPEISGFNVVKGFLNISLS
ncbi:MAG: arginine--tRNA ligase, partial [Bacteroidales bacterium]|nr:arginine--tRNA ligase [Bacteroidales bacterium]